MVDRVLSEQWAPRWLSKRRVEWLTSCLRSCNHTRKLRCRVEATYFSSSRKEGPRQAGIRYWRQVSGPWPSQSRCIIVIITDRCHVMEGVKVWERRRSNAGGSWTIEQCIYTEISTSSMPGSSPPTRICTEAL